MTLQREQFNKDSLTNIEITDVESSISSKSIITPHSYNLKRSKSESDVYIITRKVSTLGSPLSNDSLISPQKGNQIYIINGDYKCNNCNNLIQIKHNFISITCNKCLKYYIKPLNKFIIK